MSVIKPVFMLIVQSEVSDFTKEVIETVLMGLIGSMVTVPVIIRAVIVIE